MSLYLIGITLMSMGTGFIGYAVGHINGYNKGHDVGFIDGSDCATAFYYKGIKNNVGEADSGTRS